MFGFLVDDVKAAVEQLRSKGYAIDGAIHEWQDQTDAYRWTYLEDPEGHILQLVDVRLLP